MGTTYYISWVELQLPDHLPGHPPRVAPINPPPPRNGCHCACNCPPPHCPPPQLSPRPIRYATGELAANVEDMSTGGFGGTWGHTRSYANRLSFPANAGNGNNWQVKEWSYLLFRDDGTIAVMGQPTKVLWFSQIDGICTPMFDIKDTLILDVQNGVYRLYDLHGGITQYSAASGVFQQYTDAAGNTVQGSFISSQRFQLHRSPT